MGKKQKSLTVINNKIFAFLSNNQLTLVIVWVLVFACLGAYLILTTRAQSINGDLNDDKTVNIVDLSILLSNFGKTTAQTTNAKADINGDGSVTIFDLSILLSNYGKTEPAPPSNQMAVGIVVGNWGASGAADIATAVNNGRLDVDSGAPTSDFTTRGIKLTILFSGPYNSGGVSALNANTWANDTLNWYKANCTPTTCPNIEILNEPAGTWFWGSNAASSANVSAYANLLKVTNTVFTNQYGSSRPRILASYDGGSAGNLTWGNNLWAADTTIGNYVDGITLHPYGGTGTKTTSAQGRRQSVIDARTKTNKPIYITEIGWPTAVGQPSTGDSLQWTEKEQAANVYDFINWAKSTGYVSEVDIFNYRDYGTNTWYGLERWGNPAGSNGSRKPAWTALMEAKNGQTCSVCQ